MRYALGIAAEHLFTRARPLSSPLLFSTSLACRRAPVIGTTHCTSIFPACCVRLWTGHIVPIAAPSTATPGLPWFSWFLAPVVTISLFHLFLPFQLFGVTPEKGVHAACGLDISSQLPP